MTLRKEEDLVLGTVGACHPEPQPESEPRTGPEEVPMESSQLSKPWLLLKRRSRVAVREHSLTKSERETQVLTCEPSQSFRFLSQIISLLENSDTAPGSNYYNEHEILSMALDAVLATFTLFTMQSQNSPMILYSQNTLGLSGKTASLLPVTRTPE